VRLNVDKNVPESMHLSNALLQVLLNVGSNAVKYGDDKGVEFNVSVFNQRLQIEVLDRGPGVEESVAVRLFEPYVRARTNVPGTGLGLSISKKLVSVMGGQIQYLPRPGGGSNFTISVPDGAEVALRPSPGPQSSMMMPFFTPPASRDISPREVETARMYTFYEVLIVEDNPVNQMILRGYLERKIGLPSNRVHCIIDGRDSLAWLLQRASRGESDVLILMDRHLPGLSGDEVSETWRSLCESMEHPAPYIVAVSASGEDHAKKSKVFDAHLPKPVKFADFARIMELAGLRK
jgi:CheY-like chemotaxis protein